ncbi:MAG TPA: sugar transferase [Ktedonobacterales bacterium]
MEYSQANHDETSMMTSTHELLNVADVLPANGYSSRTDLVAISYSSTDTDTADTDDTTDTDEECEDEDPPVTVPVVAVMAREAELDEPPQQATPTDGYVAGSPGYEIAKRTLDLVGSSLGLVVLAPLFAVIAVCVKLEDRGPIIHRRRIVGCDGVEVDAFKFRTMIPDADTYLLTHPELMEEYAANVKLRRDPRVTRVGALLRRTSLDELPQLVNVLRGEMSLVGPRMIHPSEEPRYGPLARTRRRVRPGITGLWQVSGRQELSYVQRLALDRYYLRCRSLRLDMRILRLTLGALLRRQGAY